jgi:hypothetical protein
MLCFSNSFVPLKKYCNYSVHRGKRLGKNSTGIYVVSFDIRRLASVRKPDAVILKESCGFLPNPHIEGRLLEENLCH